MKPCSYKIVAAAICALLTGSVAAQTDNQRMAQLEARLQAMEAELQQFKQQSANTVTAADVDAVVKKVLADSSARSAGARAGYSNGFFIADQGNNFQAKLNGLLQPRYIYNDRDSTAGDDDEGGFQIRRAELYLTGNAFNQRVIFQLAGGFQSTTGNFTIVSAYGGYQFNKEWEVRGGVFKPPFMIEELTAAGRQQTVERSLLNAYFSAGTSEGAQIQYTKDAYKLAVMVHDGTGAYDTEFNADKTDIGVAARGEIKLAGDWPQFADFDGWRDSKFAARLGGAVDYEVGESGDSDVNPNFVKYTIDLTVKGSGWNAFLAGTYKYTDSSSAAESLDQYGMLAQGGVFVIPNRVELFARYEHIYFDGAFNATTPVGDNHVNLVTVGANWFLLAHNAKISTDVIYVFDEFPANVTGMDLVASPNGPQIVVRTGLSLMF
jgi:hypothetical protein